MKQKKKRNYVNTKNINMSDADRKRKKDIQKIIIIKEKIDKSFN